MAVQQEVHTRLDEVDRLRCKQVERARYEADQAQRGYMHVDPANRFVVGTLETEWNSKLRALIEAQKECERLRQTDHLAWMRHRERASRVWLAISPACGKTPEREKKRMVGLLLEDVNLLKGEADPRACSAQGRPTEEAFLDAPCQRALSKEDTRSCCWRSRSAPGATDPRDRRHSKRNGLRSGTGQPFTVMTVINIDCIMNWGTV